MAKIVYIVKQYEEGSEKADKDSLSLEKYSTWHQNCAEFVVDWKALLHQVEDFKWIADHFGMLAW